MLIDFKKIDENTFKNFRGGQKEVSAKIFFDGKNKIMKASLIPGASIGMHTHDTSSEIIYVLKGKGKILTEQGDEFIQEGSCHYCPKGKAHSLINSGDEDLIIFAVIPEQ